MILQDFWQKNFFSKLLDNTRIVVYIKSIENTGEKMDYFNYMLQNEMERIESIADAIEADSAPVEQLPEVKIDWENIPWEKF